MSEDFSLKAGLFREIDALLVDQAKAQRTILASNTSSISLTKLASNVSNPANFVGMHFFYPVPVMQLVESHANRRSKSSAHFKLRMRHLRRWKLWHRRWENKQSRAQTCPGSFRTGS